MAASTGVVLAAGGLTLTEQLLTGWKPETAVRLATATVLAALVSAGLDKITPGLGTGLGVLLLFAALFKSGPKIADHLFK